LVELDHEVVDQDQRVINVGLQSTTSLIIVHMALANLAQNNMGLMANRKNKQTDPQSHPQSPIRLAQLHLFFEVMTQSVVPYLKWKKKKKNQCSNHLLMTFDLQCS
jgi:hypothetical protein